MKQKKKNRALSLLLALVMVFSLLPVGAWAAEEPTFGDFFTAIPATAEQPAGSPTLQWKVKQLDGTYVLQSPSGFSNATRAIKLTFTAATHLTFAYKISSEPNYDYLKIQYDGTDLTKNAKDKFSGEVGWQTYELNVDAGKVLEVGYYKDGGGDGNGSDCVWLRNFSAGAAKVVTFHANGGEGNDSTQNFFGAGKLNANAFTKSGSVFSGWATASNGPVVYADGAGIEPEANLDLYAVWADAYTVTFDNNGSQSTVSVAQNTALGSSGIPKPTRTGYVFGGWFSGDAQLTENTMIASNITYTAKWTPISYTIKFDANGGTGTMVDLSAIYDANVSLPENAFTRTGYQFLGWGTYSGTVSYAAGAAVKNLESTDGASRTLYAVWAGLPVPVTIDLNYDTEGKTTERSCVVGQNYNYIYNADTKGAVFQFLAEPTRAGYLFGGWFNAAEGGSEITNQTKFSDVTPVTLYAHWTEAVTVTFNANGGTCYTTSKQISKGAGYGTLPTASLSGKVFDGWYTAGSGGEKVDGSTVFNADVTLYAHWRNYRYTIKFNANGGTGTMSDQACESGTATLSANAFTRDGYKFKSWCTSKTEGSCITSYTDGQEIQKTVSYDGSSITLYAIWTQTAFGKAFDAISAKLPSDGIIRNASLSLPGSGDGYTITYRSSDTASISDSGEVLSLPETGTRTVTMTATVTDTSDNSTENKDYVLTLYSAKATEAETTLKAAADSLTGNFKPVYGSDSNANTAVENRLQKNGYSGVSVSVKEAKASSDGLSSIDTDGTIHYYFNKSMSGSGGYFYITFQLAKDGVSVEKEWYTNLGWDNAKVQTVLEEEIARISLPTEPVTQLSLPKYPIKDGVDQDAVDYNDYNDFDTWATITWSSSDDGILKVESPSYPPYSPYPVKLTRSAAIDQAAELTASICCNSVNGVSVTKAFTVSVARISQADADAVQNALAAKLETGFAAKGLRSYVTGEKLTPDKDGVYTISDDIQFPTTRDFGIDGKYYPVTIKSSDSSTIVPPDVNNAARVTVYRPLPGQPAQNVTLTLAITDKSNGVSASKDFKVLVQPLTQDEINSEIALMEQAKAHYFDGIKNANTNPEAITTNLRAFQEVYLNNETLTWVYDRKDLKNHGIVPEAMNGWEDLEQWRLFRSSNAAVISNENLLVTRQTESKAVTVTSYLSSETLGKYAAKYPGNADFRKLYYQPVQADLIVTGTNPTSDTPVAKKLTASLTLQSADSTWIPATTVSGLSEGSTVFDVFNQVLRDKGYVFDARGSYVYAITNPSGQKLGEFDEGKDSGWMYKVNGVLPSAYMAAYTLTGGENIVVFFTKDYTQEAGHMGEDPNKTPKNENTKIEPETSVSGNKATVSILESSVKNAIEAIQKSDGKVISIVPKDTGSAANISISIPKAAAKSVAEETKADLKVETGVGSITIPNEALASIAAQASDETVTVNLETVESSALSAEQQKAVGKDAVYDISILSGKNYISSFNGKNISIALPYTLKSGESAANVAVWYLNDAGKLERMVCTYDKSTGLASFATTHLSKYVVGYESWSNPFTDVKTGDWFYDAVKFAAQKELFNGTSATSFAPDESMTRAMLVTVLYRMEGKPAVTSENSFTDVKAGQWYTDAVLWANANKLVEGYGNGSFGTNDSITREQIAVILYRYAQLKKYDVSKSAVLTKYSDAASISAWAGDAMKWANGESLINGTTETTLAPRDTATRAQVAAVLMRFAENIAE